MVSLLCLNALSGGFSVSIYKVIGELVTSSTIDDAGFLITVLLIFALVSNVLQMHLLNLAMKYYDQIEVIPICMTSLIVCQILCGLLFLDEISYYSAGGLSGIFAGSFVCVIGIMFLMKKNSFLQSEKHVSDVPVGGVDEITSQKAKSAGLAEESERLQLLSFLTESEIEEDN